MIFILYSLVFLTINVLFSLIWSIDFAPFFIAFSPFVAFLIVFLLISLHLPFMKNVQPHNKYINRITKEVIMLVNHVFLRLRVEIKGEFPSTSFPHVLYANHTSYTDALCVIQKYPYPLTFTPKVSVLKLPFIGSWVTMIGAFPIDRNHDRVTARNMIQAIQTIQNGHNMIIFPEGSVKDRYLEYVEHMKPGAFKLAQKSKATIIPIKIGGDIDLRRLSFFRPKNKNIQILNELSFTHYQDMSTQELSDHVIYLINQSN
jgi:1-acyl-sn-glycerol-3-phosphate acyltransferase